MELFYFLGAFAKLQKATITFVMSACLSARDNSAPLEGFSWNFIFRYFSKICRENSNFYQNLKRPTGTSREDKYTFMKTSRSISRRMKNISDKIYRGIQNTHFKW